MFNRQTAKLKSPNFSVPGKTFLIFEGLNEILELNLILELIKISFIREKTFYLILSRYSPEFLSYKHI